VVTLSNPTDGVNFNGCTFRNVGVGIAATVKTYPGFYSAYKTVVVGSCLFENVTGPAIHVRTRNEDFVRYAALSINNSRFLDCGSAVDAVGSPKLQLTLATDTLIACRGTAIEADIEELALQHTIISAGDSSGAVFHLKGAGLVAIADCLFA